MHLGDISDLIVGQYDADAAVILYEGDCMNLLRSIPDGAVQLLVTSPPYNLGKKYEQKLSLETYLKEQAGVIAECVRVLSPLGSLCWQVGNYVDRGAIVPLDSALYPTFLRQGLQLRNRIVWHFEHGLHCKNRFSGRYETVNWFTKSVDYKFHLDPVRVPQKYPGKKHFKGPKTGQYSSNPLGKNPGDVWTIPNVKSNHVEKTEHPCQFPVELVERLVLSLSDEGDLVLDPFVGVGSSMVAALRHNRRAAGAEIMPKYVSHARKRLIAFGNGLLRTRPMGRPVYDPILAGNSLTRRPWQEEPDERQLQLIRQRQAEYEQS